MNNSLIGKIEVQFYDKDNNLKRVVNGKNTVTTQGVKRLCEVLTQGFKNGNIVTENLSGIKLNTFPNGQNSVGLNIVEWQDKEFSTFEYSENIQGLNQANNLFADGENGDYAYFEKDNSLNDKMSDFYFPAKENELNNKDNSGWVADLGLKHIFRKEFCFTTKEVVLCDDFGVPYTNVKYNSLKITDKDGNVLEEEKDYDVLDWGDYDTPPKILFLDEKLLNSPLFLSYSYFNVPNVPIVGFCFDCVCTGDEVEASKNFISGWSWSLNQGKSKLPHLFPNLSGGISGNSISIINNEVSSNGMHQAVWFTPNNTNEKRFYIHSYPYGVVNPTQLVWYGHLQNNSKCYFKNFSLLGMELPKLGPQVIELGSGDKTPTPNDTSLTSPISNTKMIIHHKRNDGTDSIKFEVKLGFDDCNSDEYIKEIGLFFPQNDDVFYSDDNYWNKHHNQDISGKNKIVKFDGINRNKCNTMFSHGLFETPWKKKKDEKVTIIYTVQINWGK